MLIFSIPSSLEIFSSKKEKMRFHIINMEKTVVNHDLFLISSKVYRNCEKEMSSVRKLLPSTLLKKLNSKS